MTTQADGDAPFFPAMVLGATILASSLSFIDGTVVNVGLPAIGRMFEGDAAGQPWVIDASLLPLSALLLLGGAMGAADGAGSSWSAPSSSR